MPPWSTLKTANHVLAGNSFESRSRAPCRASGAVATGRTSKTRTTRLARDGVVVSAGEAAAPRAASGGAGSSFPGARTSRKDSISQRVPSSKTWTSSARRSATVLPFRSRATRSSRTTCVSERKLGGACAETMLPAVRRTLRMVFTGALTRPSLSRDRVPTPVRLADPMPTSAMRAACFESDTVRATRQVLARLEVPRRPYRVARPWHRAPAARAVASALSPAQDEDSSTVRDRRRLLPSS